MGPARGQWRPKIYKDVRDDSSKNSLIFLFALAIHFLYIWPTKFRGFAPKKQ
jgi:hypothetical protein